MISLPNSFLSLTLNVFIDMSTVGQKYLTGKKVTLERKEREVI